MPIERVPRHRVPPVASSTHSTRHRVRDGESWYTLADRYGVPVRDIISFNFATLVSAEVNWYLHHYVGCKRITPDGNNWMFSDAAKPGFIQIPPQSYEFDTAIIECDPPVKYYDTTVEPSKWTPPAEAIDGEDASGIVSIDPWRHTNVTIGSLRIKTRTEWGASDPVWANEVTYYNTTTYPLQKLMKTIVIHHTANNKSIKDNEVKEIGEKKFAAIGYHFFIEKDGTILEGRPLEVMGSNAGEGLRKGKLNDPDFGSIGIVLRGDYLDIPAVTSDPPAAQLESLTNLVIALRNRFPAIRSVLKHNEVIRGKDPTRCPGGRMNGRVDELKKQIGL